MENTMWLFLLSLITVDAMPSAEYGQLTSTLDQASFSSDQLRILESLPAHTTLTMSQSIALLAEFSFASHQLNALKIIAPYIQDRDQQYLLIETFTFSSDKQKAGDILSQTPYNRQIQMETAEAALQRKRDRERQMAIVSAEIRREQMEQDRLKQKELTYRERIRKEELAKIERERLEAERLQNDRYTGDKIGGRQLSLDEQRDMLDDKTELLEIKQALLEEKMKALELQERELERKEDALQKRELELQNQNLELKQWEIRLKEWERRLNRRHNAQSSNTFYRSDSIGSSFYWGGYEDTRRSNH